MNSSGLTVTKARTLTAYRQMFVDVIQELDDEFTCSEMKDLDSYDHSGFFKAKDSDLLRMVGERNCYRERGYSGTVKEWEVHPKAVEWLEEKGYV